MNNGPSVVHAEESETMFVRCMKLTNTQTVSYVQERRENRGEESVPHTV